MKVLSIFVLLGLIGCASADKKEVSKAEPMQEKANIAFEISEGILHPESIIYSEEQQAFFVSNVASGNPMETKPVGYISRISKDGTTVNAKWVTGLHAPKGLSIVGDYLYVSDVTRVHRISISKSKIVKTFNVKDAGFLNDTVADAAGNVYISDMANDVIYRIKHDKLTAWAHDPKLQGSNGLFTDGKAHLIVTRWGDNMDPKTFKTQIPGNLAVIDLKNPTKIEQDKAIQGNLDGISLDNKGVLWISDWMNGDVYTLTKKGKAKKVYNFGQGTADIAVAKELNMLLVPQMGQNKLLFIKL